MNRIVKIVILITFCSCSNDQSENGGQSQERNRKEIAVKLYQNRIVGSHGMNQDRIVFEKNNVMIDCVKIHSKDSLTLLSKFIIDDSLSISAESVIRDFGVEWIVQDMRYFDTVSLSKTIIVRD